MNNEEITKQVLEYLKYLGGKIKNYNATNGKNPTVDFDFLELSDYDFNKIMLYTSFLKFVRNNMFDPTAFFKDKPEMLMTYYLIEGKNLFSNVGEEAFVVINAGLSPEAMKMGLDERMKRLYKVVSENKDLKDKVISNVISYYTEYGDYLLSNYNNPSFQSECVNSVYKLIQLEGVSLEDAKKIYEKLISKYDLFKSINYDNLVEERPDFLLIPGIIDMISSDGLIDSISSIFGDNEETTDEEIYIKLKEIYEANKDRPGSIHHFIKLIREIDHDGEFVSFLSTHPEFKELFDQYNNGALNEAKAIYEGKDVEIANSMDLSKEPFFKDNLDQMIKSYLNNGASNGDLSLAILIAYAEKLKKSKDLEFEVVVNTNNVQANTLGYYDDESKVLYLNPSYVQEGKLNFVNNLSTIFHEVQHALQFQKIFDSDDYSYTNLSMIVDNINSKDLISSYYRDNYVNIAYEIDARSAQLYETLKFIDEYCPEMRELFKNNFKSNLTDSKVRKNWFSYTSGLQLFLDDEQINGDIRKKCFEGDKSDEDMKQYYLEEIESLKRRLLKFPVFEYDEEEYRFKLKSEEELTKLKEKYEIEQDEVGLDLINNVLYDIELGKFLEGKEFTSLGDAVAKAREGMGGK